MNHHPTHGCLFAASYAVVGLGKATTSPDLGPKRFCLSYSFARQLPCLRSFAGIHHTRDRDPPSLPATNVKSDALMLFWGTTTVPLAMRRESKRGGN